MYWFFSVDDGTNDDRDQMIRFDVFFPTFPTLYNFLEIFDSLAPPHIAYKRIHLTNPIKRTYTFDILTVKAKFFGIITELNNHN